ncbi:AraC family transcriptional regulator [Prescottella equi]|jgi:transcriptional regulator GlxA family with amidase domain|uniref:GlxA family transcriptional regulator n=1 Tax=Rhodococcus TaxID=1827 RepID=UPI0004A91B3C|nr:MULTISPECIES: helix-turn-helix domain-containing protein [Rhodococcus]OCC17134.1 AraC family transcriptional regulator [Prescottella equi]AUS34842.1 AraC family transcriptional regulator [Rhodococcus qingshengii]KDQ02805.1 AraC family transcriptional regulator [Rhodococcus qingshengii]MBT9298928.1 helix-turn-helix domain-containing protein [Rhodococcus sp. GOMB7]MCC4301723.1 helix-turn-helix domain-containing protein [Rhodococcus sp. 3-2]
MHDVAVLALPGVVPMDLAAPLEVFGRCRLPSGAPAYRTAVCALTEEVETGTFTMRVPHGLSRLAQASTIIIPGTADLDVPVDAEIIDALRSAADRGTRIASLCVGAFTLADTGLLDGLRATTHWAAAAELARRHPAVDVDAAVLYVDNGHILTSAGAAAALDLCLYMVRQDYGSAVAADTARLSVMPLERAGGQAQFIVHEPPVPSGTTLRPLLNWMEENLGEQLDITTIAARATMSTRTLNRRFQEQIGTTPLQWLHHARLRQAQFLLETTDHSIERVAGQVGFNAVTTFRERFRDLVGTSPQRYRTQFRTSR